VRTNQDVILRFVDRSETPFPFARFLGIDKRGLLYVGERANMESARKDIVTGIENWHKHMAGIMIHILRKYSRFFRRYHSFSRLEYRFEQHQSKDSRKRREEQLIKKYVCKFGEVPPLNSAIPNRHYDW
jgi:hypothetical protein